MSAPCLHCALHATIQAHFGERYPVRADGRFPVEPAEALTALAKVAADVIGSAGSDQGMVDAFQFLMGALTGGLAVHGMHLQSSFSTGEGAASGERLH